jgi:hypothetical protein
VFESFNELKSAGGKRSHILRNRLTESGSNRKCADDMASENNIGGHKVDAMYAYARQLRESKGANHG